MNLLRPSRRLRAPQGRHPAGRPLACAVALALAALACSGDDCDQVDTEIGIVCIPDALAPERMATLEVREACGSHCARGPSCTAVLLDGALQLTLREDHCSPGLLSCDGHACSQVAVPCTVPPLAAGDYPVLVRGGPAQLLRVRPGGTSVCRLAVPPPAP